MTWFSIDVEADGPIVGTHSMIAIGACTVADPSDGFVGYLAPISQAWDPEALAVSGFSREETEAFPSPLATMLAFERWVLDRAGDRRPIFAADNNGYDWQWVNWYALTHLGRNIFGFSSRNINDIYHGLVGDSRKSFKHLRRTKHDHNPMHDAMGNAEALLHMRDEMGYKVRF